MNDHCSVEGCATPWYARSLCKYHYNVWHRHGDPTFIRSSPLRPNGQKVCSGCGYTKPLTEFSPHRTSQGGVASRCRECGRDYYQTRVKADRDRRRLRYFGLSPEAFDALLKSQGGGCAICGRLELPPQQGWHIDHDHSCCPQRVTCGNCVRGILCQPCNVGIGLLGDTEAAITRALDYLKSTMHSRAAVSRGAA